MLSFGCLEWGTKVYVLLGVEGPVRRVLSFPRSEGSHVEVEGDTQSDRKSQAYRLSVCSHGAAVPPD